MTQSDRFLCSTEGSRKQVLTSRSSRFLLQCIHGLLCHSPEPLKAAVEFWWQGHGTPNILVGCGNHPTLRSGESGMLPCGVNAVRLVSCSSSQNPFLYIFCSVWKRLSKPESFPLIVVAKPSHMTQHKYNTQALQRCRSRIMQFSL